MLQVCERYGERFQNFANLQAGSSQGRVNCAVSLNPTLRCIPCRNMAVCREDNLKD